MHDLTCTYCGTSVKRIKPICCNACHLQRARAKSELYRKGIKNTRQVWNKETKRFVTIEL